MRRALLAFEVFECAVLLSLILVHHFPTMPARALRLCSSPDSVDGDVAGLAVIIKVSLDNENI